MKLKKRLLLTLLITLGIELILNGFFTWHVMQDPCFNYKPIGEYSLGCDVPPTLKNVFNLTIFFFLPILLITFLVVTIITKKHKTN